MNVTWWEVFGTMSALLFAMWIASKLEFRGCEKCDYDCDQGRKCPYKKDKQ